jgi:hypothetical protein
MTTCIDLADYRWLTGNEAAAVLADLAADTTPVHTLVAQLRKQFTATKTHLLMEQTELRRRAASKFTQPHRMFFTRHGLEQATDEWVATYKTSRFHVVESLRDSQSHLTAFTNIADLCCGIAGDLMALARTTTVFGVDRDPITAHFAALNSGVTIYNIDITDADLAHVTAFHIDPDRRSGTRHGSRVSKRTTSLEYCDPSLTFINKLLAQIPNAAVKLAPATDVGREWSERCELEWISRDRECRQQVAWHGALAASPGQHRATIVSSACQSAPHTITGRPKQPVLLTDKPNRYIFDVDPAILAAKLKGALAAEHNLSALSYGPTYLTGPQAIADPALACFEVDDVAPFHITKLAKWLRARNIGQLEIKKRGVDVDPEKLRRDLKLRGNNAATLLITAVAARPTAILAHRAAE